MKCFGFLFLMFSSIKIDNRMNRLIVMKNKKVFGWLLGFVVLVFVIFLFLFVLIGLISDWKVFLG